MDTSDSEVTGDKVGGNILAGIAAGVEAEYRATDLFGISAGFIYSMQGKSWDNYSVISDKGKLGWEDMKVSLNYINIPILANIHIGEHISFKLGLQPGILVSAKAKGTLFRESGETEMDKDIKDDCKTLDLSIPIGVAYDFDGSWVLDLRSNFGVTKIRDDRDSRNTVVMMTIGYKFEL